MKNRRRLRRAARWIWPATIVVAALWVVWAWIVAPMWYLEERIEDLEKAALIRSGLRDFKSANGEYPTTLEEIIVHLSDREREYLNGMRDAWGNRFDYRTRSDAYLLIGLGRNGVPDELDYWELRVANTSHRICGDWDADQVVSDVGWHRYCGK